MRQSWKMLGWVGLAALLMGQSSCDKKPSSDTRQAQQQEVLLSEATSQVGMPAIKNFRERKMLKDILEMRDQTGLSTYTYLWSDMQGKLIFLCHSVGYAVPYATQFTNPQKIVAIGSQIGHAVTAQADPNGLFSPASAEGTWVQCKDPKGDRVSPVYIEPRILVSQFRFD